METKMKKILILLLLIVSTSTAKDVKYNYDALVFISHDNDTVWVETKTNVTISGNSMKIRVPEFKKNKVLNLDFKLTLNKLDSTGVRQLHFKNKKYYGAGYFDNERANIVFETENETKFTFIYFKR